MKVQELIARIPAQASEEVWESYRRNGQAIRDAVRNELRLTLTRRGFDGGSSTLSPEDGRLSVSLDEVGMPDRIRVLEIPPGRELAALVAMVAGELKLLAHSSEVVDKFLNDHWMQFQVLDGIRKERGSLASTAKLAEELLRLYQGFNLVGHILSVDEDILRCYVYDLKGRTKNGKIFLYWGVIGLISITLGVPIEALTCVVLAHEYAHAYTHLGFDIDGRRWESIEFRNSEKSIKEGLAQYYTDHVMNRLNMRIPRGIETYKALLAEQSKTYKVHIPWMVRYSPEVMRGALVISRAKGAVNVADFETALEEVKTRMEGHPPS